MAEPRALPPPVPGGDLAEVVARFGAGLRRAGLPVGPGRCERFASAVTLARPRTPDALYLCALATLVSGRDQIEILQGVFNQVFGGLTDPAGRRGDQDGPAPARPSTPEDLLAQAAQAAKAHVSDSRLAATPGAGPDGADRDDSSEPEREIEHRYLGSTVERLAGQDFAELSESELLLLAELMRGITLAVPARRSRRQHRRPGGPRTDVRSTLRQARRTGGYAFRLISRAPSRRPRRLVVLCDISGSMEPYARAMIQLLYCAAGGARAEVFSFATRLTRLTPALARTLPGPALQRAGEAAPDWLGGTRIGASIKEFNDVYGRRGMARGAIIVIISDGWDTGDPEVLRREMERLSLVAFRIVWVNPRTKSTSYQPLAGGMAAAWPHCDAVVSAHTLAALDQLTASLADPVRRRAPVRPPLTPPAPGPHQIRSHAAGEKRLAAVGLAFLVSDEYAAEHADARQPEHGGIGSRGLGGVTGDVAPAEHRHTGVDHAHFGRNGNGHPAKHRHRPDGDFPSRQDGVAQVDVGAAEDGYHRAAGRNTPGALPRRAAEHRDDPAAAFALGPARGGYRRRGIRLRGEILEQRYQIGVSLGRVDGVEPVRVLLRGQPAFREGLVEDRRGPVPVRVGRA